MLRYTGSHTASGKWAEMLYRVVFEGANLIKISLVMAAAMLAICGGPSLLLAASALHFSGGVMFYAGLKRRV